MSKTFLGRDEHFAALVKTLPEDQRRLYDELRNTRSESCYRGRSFIAYEMVNREPKVLDEIEVLDFVCNEAEGSSTELRSRVTGKTLEVGYTPVKVFDLPVFVWVPLYVRTRWCASAEDVGRTGSLAFDLSIRTRSFLNPRERGMVHLLTGVAWAGEFKQAA